MSDHDGVIANDTGAAVRSDLNLLAQAILNGFSGASAPAAPVAYQRWNDTTNLVVKQRNAANTGWLVRGNIAETFVLSRSSNTILAAADHDKTIVATAGYTQTFTAAATLGDGWEIGYRVEVGATLVFDPNASETIDGATTKTVVGPASGKIRCNGSAFFTVGMSPSQGLLKAWARFNGTGTPAIDASYNVASITDNATGDFSFATTVNFASANFAVAGMCGDSLYMSQDGAALAAGSIRVQTKTAGGTLTDGARNFWMAAGDQ